MTHLLRATNHFIHFQIPMKPGEIIIYESACCLHGRMRPLTGKGSFYVNLFAHYRPNGDPDWSFKSTPEGLSDMI